MTPQEILDEAFLRANLRLDEPIIKDEAIGRRVELISKNIKNRATVRLVMACLLAKIHNPLVDIRKPYTEIGDTDAFSGRTYDERYVTEFILKYNLPCNPTTAFLTPALRNIKMTLTPDLDLVGTPRLVYSAALLLLSDVHENRVSAIDLLAEIIRVLINFRDEKTNRIRSLLAELEVSRSEIPLSAEAIIDLIQQHLAIKGSSRLPVLIVAAAYQTASSFLKEKVVPLEAHNAADLQTEALGDVQITLANNDDVITVYEMKTREVTVNDLDQAILKIIQSTQEIHNYIFITTESISESVRTYALTLYEKTGGVEIIVLDCVGFLRHFLHLFHGLRIDFLNSYQALVLAEPDSAISQTLKEALLVLRQAVENLE